MDTKKAVVLFAFIATANSLLLSERMSHVLEQCNNQSTSILDLLKLETECRTPGDRGVNDLLCNGVYSIILDVCNKSSSITLGQVKNSSKFDDTTEIFCKKIASADVFSSVLPANVSKNLNMMRNASTCPVLCKGFVEMNPMCPFIFSYSVIRTVPTLEKNDTRATPVKEQGLPKTKINVQKATIKENTPENPKPPSETEEKKKSNTAGAETKDTNKPENPKPMLDITTGQKGTVGSDTPVNPPNSLGSENDQSYLEGFSNKNGDLEITNNNQPINDTKKSTKDQKTVNQPEKLPGVDTGDGLDPQQQPKVDIEKTVLDSEPFDEAEGGNFFTYFVFISALCMFFYVAMYNKKKILALLIEGRRSNVKRRPNSAAYSKLDCTLEEAMASGPSTSSSNTLLY